LKGRSGFHPGTANNLDDDINDVDRLGIHSSHFSQPSLLYILTTHCLAYSINNPMSGNDDLPELPAAPPSQVVGQGYSANHKIPTVQGYKQDKARQEEEAKSYAQMIEKRQREAAERLEKVSAEQNANNNGLAPKSGDDHLDDGKQQETNVLKNRKGKKDDQSTGGVTDEKSRMMEQMNSNKGM
jgi:hypothetical protein